MCKYCDSDTCSYFDMPRYHCDIQKEYYSETEAVIHNFRKNEPKKKKHKLAPMLIVIGKTPSSDDSYQEYVRQISYCPWCGEKLSDESYTAEGLR